MSQANNVGRCHTTLDQDSSLIAVVERSHSSWPAAGIVAGISRHPTKTLKPDKTALLGLLRRWQDEAAKLGRRLTNSRERRRKGCRLRAARSSAMRSERGRSRKPPA
jgi:hypothetical protein